MTRLPNSQWPESVHSKKRDANRQHVIAVGPRYVAGDTDYDAAPMECSCGWAGRSGDFSDHRASLGLRKKSLSGGGGRAIEDDAA